MRKAFKCHGSLEAITAGGLGSYRAAMTELGDAEKQEIDQRTKNRVKNS